MCILKQAEPKGRGSVIRPMKQMLVEGVGQTGRREGALAGGAWHRRRRGRPGPSPAQTRAVTRSKLKLPASVPPIYLCELHTRSWRCFKVVRRKARAGREPGRGPVCMGPRRRPPLQPPAEGPGIAGARTVVKETVCK